MKHQLQRNLGVLLIGIGLLLGACGIYGLIQPDEFRASAKIVVSEEVNDFNRICYPEISQREEILKSDTVLSNVVREFKPNSEQNSQADSDQNVQQAKAIAALRKRLEVRQVPNTRLFEITLTERTPAGAAKCANALAIAYKTEILNRQRALVQGSIEELKHQLKLQEQKASELEAELLRLRETLKLRTPEPPKEELKTNFPTYYEVNEKLDDEKDIMRLLTRKINIEETKLQPLGNSPQIEIVETAIPPTYPVGRKKLLGTVLLVAGLGCCLWGLTVAPDAKLTAKT